MTIPKVNILVRDGFPGSVLKVALYGKYPKLQILTIRELFDGKKPDIPLVESSFKKAPKEAERSTGLRAVSEDRPEHSSFRDGDFYVQVVPILNP